MAHTWEAQHPVDRDLAMRLVGERFPELAVHTPERVGEGWDNVVWRFGEVAFRFPRRDMGVALVEVEARVLPHLQSHLPVAVPAATHLGAPTDAFPYPWFGHPFLAGTTADRLALSDDERRALVPDLIALLEALHGVDPATTGAPPDAFRGNVPWLVERSTARLELLERTRHADLAARAREALVDPPEPGGDVVQLHGDLYARHLLLDDERRLCGVIDWGDVCVGDRAVDLALAYGLLPPDAREVLLDALGADGPTRRRARLRCVTHSVAVLAYASDVGDDTLEAEGERALRHALVSDGL